MAQPSSKLHCCVPHCTSDSRYESNLSFHAFPKSQEIRKQWIKAIRRNEGPLFKIAKCTVVCGKHFRDEEKKKTICKTKLARGAVPSVFAWTDVTPMQRPHQRFDRMKKVLAKVGVDGEILPMTSDEDDDDDDDDEDDDGGVYEAVAMETEHSVFQTEHSQLHFKQENCQLPANMTSDMEFENVKVKVEPCEKGQGQEGENLSQPYALELLTEDGERIVIKQEKDVHDVYIDNALSESVFNSGTDKPVVGNSDELAAATVKSEPKPEPKTLLRRALIDLTADDALPISAGKIFPFIKKEPSATPPVSVKKEKIETGDESFNDSTQVTKIKDEKDLQSTGNGNPEKSANDASTSSNLVVSPNAANVLFKAAADIGSKGKAEKSNKIKIVFDLSGKLKEWRVEPKSSDSTMPASNLGKILMFANMMKNTNNDGTSVDKDVPNLAKLQSAINANLKAKSSSPPAKKMRMSEEESLGGEVEGDFEGYKCKICSKEFLHKHAHTAHMKIHHLSLSGLPGSSPKYRDPQACRIIPLKKSSASATTTASSPPKTTATATKTSTSSVSTGTSELLSPPRPVTLVSSKTITKLGPAGPPKPTSANTQVSIQAKDLPEGAVEALTGPSTSGSYKRSAVTVPTPVNFNKGIYKCELCDKVYQRIFMYQLHMKSHHREKPFMCGICDNSYYMYSDLQSHLLNHSDPNQKTAVHFTCSQCDKEFETEEDLQEHLKIHGNVETETVYECGMCGKELNTQQELKYHMKRHMGDPFEPCKCGICMSSFSEVEELKKHIAIEHFTHAEFVCDFCKCRFLTSEALKAHMPVHEKLNEVKIKVQHRWKCKYCARRFEFRTEMMTHIAKDHPLNRFYDCSFCETSFSTKEDLQAHIKTHSVVAHFL